MWTPSSLPIVRFLPPHISEDWSEIGNATDTRYYSNKPFEKGSQSGFVCLSYSIAFATYDASPLPYTFSTKANITSIPALIPEPDHIFPSTTHLALGTHSTAGTHSAIFLKAILFVVALLPSKIPVRATTNDPVHTVIRYLRLGYTRAMNSTISLM